MQFRSVLIAALSNPVDLTILCLNLAITVVSLSSIFHRWIVIIGDRNIWRHLDRKIGISRTKCKICYNSCSITIKSDGHEKCPRAIKKALGNTCTRFFNLFPPSSFERTVFYFSFSISIDKRAPFWISTDIGTHDMHGYRNFSVATKQEYESAYYASITTPESQTYIKGDFSFKVQWDSKEQNKDFVVRAAKELSYMFFDELKKTLPSKTIVYHSKNSLTDSPE